MVVKAREGGRYYVIDEDPRHSVPRRQSAQSNGRSGFDGRSGPVRHGTNSPESILHFVSYGRIQMYNVAVMDLFDRVSVGTNTVVLR